MTTRRKPSDEFFASVKGKTTEQIKGLYDEHRARYEKLEAERQACWKRMIELDEEKDSFSLEMQCLGIVLALREGRIK